MGMSDQYDDGRYDSPPAGDYGYYTGRYGRRTPFKRPKGIPVTQPTKTQIANELRINTELQQELQKRRRELQAQMKKAIPAEPLPHTMFTVSVRFAMRGKQYQFLVLRSGTRYYTTGTKPGTEMFENWAALMAWLEGPDVYSHSDLEILRSTECGVSFDTGAVEDLNKEQVPY